MERQRTRSSWQTSRATFLRRADSGIPDAQSSSATSLAMNTMSRCFVGALVVDEPTAPLPVVSNEAVRDSVATVAAVVGPSAEESPKFSPDTFCGIDFDASSTVGDPFGVDAVGACCFAAAAAAASC